MDKKITIEINNKESEYSDSVENDFILDYNEIFKNVNPIYSNISKKLKNKLLNKK